ncbi:MAG TPA: methionyl-tRNA formyltransferase [Steroidobacteraceae bacterium]
MKLRVAFAGTPEFALPALAALGEAHEIVGVLTQPDRPAGRGRALAASPVKQAALLRGWRIAQPATLRAPEACAPLIAWSPDVLVVVAYGLLLPAAVLALPRHGCLNIHASLLPRWRGAAPIQRAILAGDAETGVTIMQMDAGLDTGPMLLQQRVPLARDAAASALHDQLATLGARALLEVLAQLIAGTLRPTAQPDAGVTYAPKIEKSEALIDWRREALAIERQVRAFELWPVAETRLAGAQLRIYRARAQDAEAAGNPGQVLEQTTEGLRVQCGRGTLLVQEVQRPGGRRISAQEFARGLREPSVQFG